MGHVEVEEIDLTVFACLVEGKDSFGVPFTEDVPKQHVVSSVVKFFGTKNSQVWFLVRIITVFIRVQYFTAFVKRKMYSIVEIDNKIYLAVTLEIRQKSTYIL